MDELQNPEPGTKCSPRATDAWVDPEGNFYYVPYAKHFKVAMERWGTEPYDLERKGWLHISGDNIYYYVIPGGIQGLTESQVTVLFDMAFAHKEVLDRNPRDGKSILWLKAFEALIELV